jgi:hypothetical protein
MLANYQLCFAYVGLPAIAGRGLPGGNSLLAKPASGVSLELG